MLISKIRWDQIMQLTMMKNLRFSFLGGGGCSIIVNGVIRFNSIVGRAQHNGKSNAIGQVIMLIEKLKKNFPRYTGSVLSIQQNIHKGYINKKILLSNVVFIVGYLPMKLIAVGLANPSNSIQTLSMGMLKLHF